MAISSIVKSITISLLVALTFTKLTDTVNILLPTAYHPAQGHAQQLVSTDGGCYQWVSTLPEVATVEGYPATQGKCFRKGLVRLNHKDIFSSSVYISAKDINTQDVLTISLRVRNLHRISIFTKSRVMNIREIQQLEVYGFDDQNNTFTSLQGMRFQWKLQQVGAIMGKVKLKDSELLFGTDRRKKIEEEGYESDVLVVKAFSIGKTQVTVRCIQPNYQQISQTITLYVQERFQINPSGSVALLTNSLFQFKLLSPAGVELQLPKKYYQFHINPQFTISNQMMVKTPFTSTSTLLKVSDTRTDPSFTFQTQINVYEPDEIKIIAKDYFIVGRDNLFKVQYYHQSQLLAGTTEQLKVLSSFPILNNKIKPTSKIDGRITVTYHSLKQSKSISALLPLVILLPTSAITLPIGQSFDLKVIGGSGGYIYSIQHPIATITYNGLIVTKKEGQSYITITDKKDHENQVKIKLMVSELEYIKTLQQHKQSIKNQQASVYVIAQTKNMKYYTQCNDIKSHLEYDGLELQLGYKPVYQHSIDFLKKEQQNNSYLREALKKSSIFTTSQPDYIKTLQPYFQAGQITRDKLEAYLASVQTFGICNVLGFEGLKKLYFDFKVVTNTPSKKVSTTFETRVYEPIESLIGDQVLMTPSSIITWETKGGPQKWPNSSTEVYLSDSQISRKQPFISCPQKQLQFNMELQLRNSKTSNLLLPISQKKKIVINCKFPQQLHIQLKNGSSRKTGTKINAAPNSMVEGNVYATDSRLNKFYNDSNLVYKFTNLKGQFKFIGNSFSGKVKQYAKFHVESSYIQNESKQISFNRISTFLEIYGEELFEVPLSDQTSTLILFNPKDQINIPIYKPTSHMEINCLGNSIDCYYDLETKTLKIKTIELGQSKIEIFDKFIYGNPIKKINIEVIQPTKLQISSQLTSIQQAQQIQIHLHLYKGNTLINDSQYQNAQLKLIFDQRYAKIIRRQGNMFTIKGHQQGKFNIVAQFVSQKIINSINSIDIYVYPTIIISSKQSKVVEVDKVYYLEGVSRVSVGCNSLFVINGGPQDMKVRYTIDDGKFIQVIALDAINYHFVGRQVGQGSIIFQLFDKTRKISRIKITVIANQINSFNIHSTSELLSKAQFRMIPQMVINGERVDDSICHFNYEWKSSDEGVIKIYNNLFIDELMETSGGVNATAVSKGLAEVQLSVKKKRSGELVFKVVKTITVVDNIYVDIPTLIGYQHENPNQLLIPPHSGYQFSKGVSVYMGNSNSVLSIDEVYQNKVVSSGQMGVTSLKLVDQNNEIHKVTSYLNVLVTPIWSIFIENTGIINLQAENYHQIRFYVQDSYGRLFHNNLINVKYLIKLSNPHPISAHISDDNNYVVLRAKSVGNTLLYVYVQGTNAYDVAPIRVGVMIQPPSPINVHLGGKVLFTAGKQQKNIWSSSNKNILQINQESGEAQAKSEGSVKVSVNGMTTQVTVYKAIDIRKVESNINLQNGIETFKLKYRVVWNNNGEEEIMANINDQSSSINNNLKFSCSTNHPNWFEAKPLIGSDPHSNGRQVIECLITSLNTYPDNQQQFNMLVSILSQSQYFKLQRTFTYPFQMMFRINKRDKTIYLTESSPNSEVIIKTNEQLEVTTENGLPNWVTSSFLPSKKQQKIQIYYPSSHFGEIIHWKIKVINKASRQTEQIDVKFSTNQIQKSGIWNLGWSDWIILFLVTSMIIVYISQKNKEDGKTKIY